MKNILFSAIALLFTVGGFAQNKNAKASVEVKGNCDRCKTRIEKAAFSVKGVKDAKWDEASMQLSVVLDENKTSMEEVETAVVKIGHDTANKRAEDEVYTNLHHCCKYERD